MLYFGNKSDDLMSSMKGKVLFVSKSENHSFSKYNCDVITLVKGLGVEGDAHKGDRVKHRSRVAQDPNQPNLRQVHLIHSELFQELDAKGFEVKAGDLGENITTSGLDLLALPRNSVLHFGEKAKILVTGLRNPCTQLDGFLPGLLKAVLDKDEEGQLVRKAGIMGIVLDGGKIRPGDEIIVELPKGRFEKLERV